MEKTRLCIPQLHCPGQMVAGIFGLIWLLKKSFLSFCPGQVDVIEIFGDSFWGIYFRAILGETENAEKRPSNPEPTAIDGFWGGREAAVFEAHGRTSL